MELIYDDNYFMKQALIEAKKAYEDGEVPVGAVISIDNRIIARAHNLTQRLNDVTAHAEIQAITSASNFLNWKYLDNCSIYVTLEPCVMCMGAIYWSKICRVVYAASDPKNGFTQTKIPSHTKSTIISGIMQFEAATLLQDFFKTKRK